MCGVIDPMNLSNRDWGNKSEWSKLFSKENVLRRKHDILMLILTPADRWVSWRELRGCLISTWWPPSSPGNADSTSTSLLPSQPEDSWRKSIHFIYLDWIIEISIERKLFSLKNLTLEHHSLPSMALLDARILGADQRKQFSILIPEICSIMHRK